MEDGNNWGALLVTWLLGAPLVGALISVMIDGTPSTSSSWLPQ